MRKMSHVQRWRPSIWESVKTSYSDGHELEWEHHHPRAAAGDTQPYSSRTGIILKLYIYIFSHHPPHHPPHHPTLHHPSQIYIDTAVDIAFRIRHIYSEGKKCVISGNKGQRPRD